MMSLRLSVQRSLVSISSLSQLGLSLVQSISISSQLRLSRISLLGSLRQFSLSLSQSVLRVSQFGLQGLELGLELLHRLQLSLVVLN